MAIDWQGSRPALVATIATLGAIPAVTGAIGALAGPTAAPGGAPTTPSVDSEYRFTNVFWSAAGFGIWWSLRRPKERAALTRVLLALAGGGGVPRVISWIRTGPPHPVFRGTIALEFVGMPIVLAWHRKVFGSASAA